MTIGDGMDFLSNTLIIIILVCSFLIMCANIYNNFQKYIIRINEAETNIDAILRKRFDLLNKSINIIKTNCNLEDKDILGTINKLRSKKLSNFELDRDLYDVINEFNKYKESYKDLQTCESFIKIDVALNESEAEIIAFRKYYNDIITDYNKLARSFPNILIAKLCGYKIKTYYDGKNMEDDITNDFKL